MSFRLFRFDVEVKIGFLITSVLLFVSSRFELDAASLRSLAVWVGVVFVSVLVHELGHAFAIRRQGVEPTITLHWMGGLTAWRETLPISRRQRVVISLAGPFSGFAFGALLFGLFFALDRAGVTVPSWVVELKYNLLFVNIGWGLINLAPVLPFDGGHVLEHALGPRREKWALGVSTAFGVALTIYFLSGRNMWGAYLFGSAALSSFMRMGSTTTPRTAPEPTDPNETSPATRAALLRAHAALDADDTDEAIRVAREVREGKTAQGKASPTAVLDALHIIAWAHVMRGEVPEAEHAVSEIRMRGRIDPALLGNVVLATGRLSEARTILEKALGEGDDRKEVFGPLIQVLLRQDEVARAVEIGLAHLDSLSSDDARKLAEIAETAHVLAGAARLHEQIFLREHAGKDALAAARAHARAGSAVKARELADKAIASGAVDAEGVRSDPTLANVLETTGDDAASGSVAAGGLLAVPPTAGVPAVVSPDDAALEDRASEDRA